MEISSGIKLAHPKKHSSVKPEFELLGYVPISWVMSGNHINDRLSLDILDIKGRVIVGMSAEVHLRKGFFAKYKRKALFRAMIKLDKFAAPSVIESQGLMTLRIRGEKRRQDFFIPIRVRSTNPNFKYDHKLLELHRNMEKAVHNNEKRYREYMDAFGEIWKRKQKKIDLNEYTADEYAYINDDSLNFGLFEIIEESFLDSSDKLNYEDEDNELQKLEEKYRDVIEIEGPLLGASILQNCGFHFIIHSNDHGMHLHAIHRGRGVDIRIKFPELEIISYKLGSLKKKDENKLISFLTKTENYSKLNNEFERRESLLNA